MKLTGQQLTLAVLVGIFVLVYYFREQLAVAAADYAGKFWPLPPAGAQFEPDIKGASLQYGVPFDLIARQLWQESRFNPAAENRGSGAVGIAQFLPSTAAQLGIDPTDPSQAIPGLAKYLGIIGGYVENNTDVSSATWAMKLAGYNWGMGHVVDAVNNYGDQWLTVAPLETQRYVGQILSSVPVEALPAGAAA